jgi:hypothetical protein
MVALREVVEQRGTFLVEDLAGLFRRFFLGATAAGRTALYALSTKGAALVGVVGRGPRRRKDAVLVVDFFASHQLTINQIYCELKYRGVPIPGVRFKRWIGFYEPLAPGVRFIPDGYVELETPLGPVAAFLEVDLGHERLAVWKSGRTPPGQRKGETSWRWAQSRAKLVLSKIP